MTGNKPAAAGDCQVVGAEKLPVTLSGDSVCAAIARAMAAKAPKAGYKVEVQVQSKARLAAELVVNGHALPTQNMAVSDGQLSERSIRRFAEGLAELAATK